jgi:hypothetical protein
MKETNVYIAEGSHKITLVKKNKLLKEDFAEKEYLVSLPKRFHSGITDTFNTIVKDNYLGLAGAIATRVNGEILVSGNSTGYGGLDHDEAKSIVEANYLSARVWTEEEFRRNAHRKREELCDLMNKIEKEAVYKIPTSLSLKLIDEINLDNDEIILKYLQKLSKDFNSGSMSVHSKNDFMKVITKFSFRNRYDVGNNVEDIYKYFIKDNTDLKDEELVAITMFIAKYFDSKDEIVNEEIIKILEGNGIKESKEEYVAITKIIAYSKFAYQYNSDKPDLVAKKKYEEIEKDIEQCIDKALTADSHFLRILYDSVELRRVKSKHQTYYFKDEIGKIISKNELIAQKDMKEKIEITTDIFGFYDSDLKETFLPYKFILEEIIPLRKESIKNNYLFDFGKENDKDRVIEKIFYSNEPFSLGGTAYPKNVSDTYEFVKQMGLDVEREKVYNYILTNILEGTNDYVGLATLANQAGLPKNIVKNIVDKGINFYLTNGELGDAFMLANKFDHQYKIEINLLVNLLPDQFIDTCRPDEHGFRKTNYAVDS